MSLPRAEVSFPENQQNSRKHWFSAGRFVTSPFCSIVSLPGDIGPWFLLHPGQCLKHWQCRDVMIVINEQCRKLCFPARLSGTGAPAVNTLENLVVIIGS